MNIQTSQIPRTYPPGDLWLILTSSRHQPITGRLVPVPSGRAVLLPRRVAVSR